MAIAGTPQAELTPVSVAATRSSRFLAYAAHELRGAITLQLTIAEVALADPNADRPPCGRWASASSPPASAKNGCSRRC